MRNIYNKRIKEVDIYEKQCYSISRKEKEMIPPGIRKDRREALKWNRMRAFCSVTFVGRKRRHVKLWKNTWRTGTGTSLNKTDNGQSWKGGFILWKTRTSVGRSWQHRFARRPWNSLTWSSIWTWSSLDNMESVWEMGVRLAGLPSLRSGPADCRQILQCRLSCKKSKKTLAFPG